MEWTGKTVEEAVSLGLAELGITEEQAEITVKEEPVKGLFGKLKGKAVVEIVKKETEKTAGEVGTEEKTLAFVEKIIELLDINAKASLDKEGENPIINLIAENSSEIIGYRGEVLDAIQTLAGAKLNIGRKEYKKIVVNCENYRERREETLVNLAHKLEAKATEMRRDVILEPMIPYERRIIHTALASSETVTTKSEGKEPNRYVIIVPNDKDEFSRPYNAGRNFDKGRHDNRNDYRGKGRGGRSFDRKPQRKSGFSEEKRAKPSGFGTYLGNSFKDKM